MSRVPVVVLILAFWPLLQADIYKIDIEGSIDPITSEYIEDSIALAEEEGAEFLLIRLATPGGLGISMQAIIQAILNSEVPIVCHVAPKGVHAASAGFFILLSADVAAMAPGTNTGAAHPVFPFGGEDETMLEKVRNDALASLRAIVEQRKRNYEMAEQGVLESKSYTAREALDGGLIDLIADSEEELLEALQGREITRFGGERHILEVEGQAVRVLKMTFRQAVLSTIADPNFALILGVIGLLGLYFEFSTPGMVLPGVLGGICLLLSLLGFSLLPVSLIGVLLILLGLGLLIAEIKVQGFGILGAGGIVSLTLGMLFLIDAPYPSLRIDLRVALGVAIALALIMSVLARLVIKVHRGKVTTGESGIVGAVGTAQSDVKLTGGKVFVMGEIWRATADKLISKGTRVKVVAAKNLDLKVEAVSAEEAAQDRFSEKES